MDQQPHHFRQKNTLLDERDAPFLEAQQIDAHLAEVLMGENGTPIVLNRQAIEFAVEALMGLAQGMAPDPTIDMPAVYNRETRRPWWEG